MGTLKYRKVARTPQVGADAGKTKYYATAVVDREMDFESFVDHIAEHNSPYSRGTVHGVLMDALDCLQELILDGKSVRLSDLGLFSLGMTSKGESSKQDVSSSSVTGVHLIVRNTKTWSNAELKKKSTIKEYDTYGSDSTSDDSGTGGSGSSTSGSSGSGSSTSGSGSGSQTSGGGSTGEDTDGEGE